MKPLFLILKGIYFRQILSGDKTIEYREKKPFWDKKFKNFDYTHVLFQLGYSDKNRFIVPIKDFIITNRYEIHLDTNNIQIVNHATNVPLFPIYS
jgi:hypothetical protein